MIKTTVSVFVIIFLVNPLACLQASQPSENLDSKNKVSVAVADRIISNVVTSSLYKKIAIKIGGKYDASKDPSLRKGTENWEQPQSSFWIIPAALVGLVFVVLFFTKQ